MLTDQLLSELHKLNRAEKLRVVQLLVDQLAEEESLLTAGTEYPIYTPYGNEAAAQVLLDYLNAIEKKDGQE